MLEKHTLNIPLGLGVNTKTDEKLVEAGNFNLTSENVSFDKIGAASKRQAYSSISNQYFLNTNNAGVAAGDYTTDTYKPISVSGLGDKVLLRNQIGQYYYSQGGDFVKRADYPVPEIKITTKKILPCTTSIVLTDTAYDANEGMVVSCGMDGNPSSSGATISGQGYTLILYNFETGEYSACAKKNATVAGAARSGFCRAGYSVAGGTSYYYLIYVDSNNQLKIYIYNKYGQEYSTSYSVSNMAALGASNAGAIAICMAADNSACYIMLPTTTANTARFIAMSGTSKVTDVTFAVNGIDWQGATASLNSSNVYLYYGNGSTARLTILNQSGVVQSADAAYGTTYGVGVSGDQDNYQKLFANESGVTRIGYFDSGSGTLQTRELSKASDKATVGGVEVMVFTDNETADIATYHVLGTSTTAGYAGMSHRGLFSSGAAISSNRDEHLFYQTPRIAKIDSNNACVALPILESINGLFDTYSMQLVFISADTEDSFSRSILGTNLHFQGGSLKEFDGKNIFENGFVGRQPSMSLDSTVAGALTGTYSYKTVLKYIDAAGNVTRSAPSAAVSTGSITSKKVTVTPGRVALGIKTQNCIVEVYRNISTSTTYHLAGEFYCNMYESSLATFTDNTTDISENEILYTEGNILENDPAPACKMVCQGGNRLFVAGLEDENEVAYSKKKLFGECANFSDFFRMRFDSTQFNVVGGITGIGYMDDKLIVFKKSSIFYVSGDGPNELGLDNTFTNPELISSDAGCVSHRSIVSTPIGLMFKGEKGIYLLSRGLETTYIGQEVEDFNSYTVTSAVTVSKKNHAVFTIVSGDTSLKYMLVYDYFTKQWSVTTGNYAVDGDIVGGDHAIVDGATYYVSIQDASNFQENGSYVQLKAKTPWIKVSGYQDFARIWSGTVLGNYKSAHTLRVKVYYDYATDYSETFDFTPSVSDSQYQYRCHLQKQKCEAVQFEIYDLAQSGTGESMELTALTLEVGLKRGSVKLAAGRKA